MAYAMTSIGNKRHIVDPARSGRLLCGQYVADDVALNNDLPACASCVSAEARSAGQLPVKPWRPRQGTPEYELLVCAMEVAIYPPLEHGTQATGQVSWRRLAELRDALDALELPWRDAKVKSDQNRADATAAIRQREATQARQAASGG